MRTLASLLITAILLVTSEAGAESTWRHKVEVDKVSGETIEYVLGSFKNSITGESNSSSKVQLFCVCGKHAIKLRTVAVGFHIDNVDCNSYTNKCENIQYCRVKFDNSQPQLVVFDVDEANNHIMILTKKRNLCRG